MLFLLEALGIERDTPDHLPLLAMRANYNLALARKAPKTLITRPRSCYCACPATYMRQLILVI